MSEVDLYELLAKLRDFHNGIAESIDAFVQKKSKVVLHEYDTEKIQWTKATGPKGEFEQTEDVNNPEYKALREDLVKHNGKFNLKGKFYWVFTNGVMIGRKPQHGR
jgi:hypothetical protein